MTFQDLGKLEEAADAYRKALSIKPDYPEVIIILARFCKTWES